MNRIILIVGVVVVVAILAGAAFVGAQMLATSPSAEAEAAGGGGQRVMETVIDDGSGPVGVRITFKPAAELPQRPAEAAGIFVSRQDNSFIVGMGAIEVDVEVDATGKETLNASHNGPEIEVVVTHDTVLYKDVTEIEMTDEGRQSGQQTIQQVVQPIDSTEAIGKNTELQVWGQRRGDRVVADVLVYQELR
jgi:hypothetical protein